MTIDVSELVPPEPMVKILEALEALGPESPACAPCPPADPPLRPTERVELRAPNCANSALAGSSSHREATRMNGLSSAHSPSLDLPARFMALSMISLAITGVLPVDAPLMQGPFGDFSLLAFVHLYARLYRRDDHRRELPTCPRCAAGPTLLGSARAEFFWFYGRTGAFPDRPLRNDCLPLAPVERSLRSHSCFTSASSSRPGSGPGARCRCVASPLGLAGVGTYAPRVFPCTEQEQRHAGRTPARRPAGSRHSHARWLGNRYLHRHRLSPDRHVHAFRSGTSCPGSPGWS